MYIHILRTYIQKFMELELYRTKGLAVQDSRTPLKYAKFLQAKTNYKKEFTKDPEQRNFKNYQYCVSANCAFW